MKAFEVNFDGIVGPTHNYSGLSHGNIASMESKQNTSSPRDAALQGLEKMKFLMDLGMVQGVLPPQERPFIPILKALGFQGSEEQMLLQAAKDNPKLLSACCSAASMWTANAATMAPSVDCQDERVHFTPANLSNKFHRAIEHKTTAEVLKAIFHDASCFVHHPALPEGSFFSDEGAANHTRFCKEYGALGVHLFVYGRHAFSSDTLAPFSFPARQTLEASEAIMRLHRLDPECCVFAQQNPQAIDSGVFHNDVISVGNRNVFLYHELSFTNTEAVLEELQRKVHKACRLDLNLIPIPEKKVSLQDLVASYLCNSQIISLPDNTMMLIAPADCESIPSVHNFINEMISDAANPINKVVYFNLHQSMRNGGGPACLRFRVVLNEKELQAANPHVILTTELYHKLKAWVEKHYRTSLSAQDLSDPSLLRESRAALDELTQILQLGAVYPFQK